jgi:hypothetical protein
MPLFLTLRGATNALPITSAWVGLKPATTNPTWTTANHSQIVSRLHRVAYPGGSILTSRGGLILDSAEAFYFVLVVLVLVDIVQGRYQKKLNRELAQSNRAH